MTESKRLLDFAKFYLDSREIQIITLRLGLNRRKPKTLQAIGEILNLSRERVRQIERIAILKLKKGLKDRQAAKNRTGAERQG